MPWLIWMRPVQRCGVAVLDGGEVREAVEGEIDFRHRSHHAVVLEFLGEARGQMRRVDQVQQGALRVGVGDDGVRGNLVAGLQNDRGRYAVFHADLCDFGVGADFGAGRFRGGRHRLRDGSDSTCGKVG